MILGVGIEHLGTYLFQALNVIGAVLFPSNEARVTLYLVLNIAQFIGRAQRIYGGTKEIEKNCQAHIITHADYEQRQLYDSLIEERLISVRRPW